MLPNKNSGANVKGVKDRVSVSLRKYPNVTGVGVGYKMVNGHRTEIISIRVYVRTKLPVDQLPKDAILPQQVDGVPVDVIEVHPRAHNSPVPIEDFQARHNPLLGGISVGNEVLGGSGTISCNVFDNVLAEGMILSNWHVLCGRTTCAIGESIIQPGTGGDDTGQPTDQVARLYRAVITDRVDAALGRLTGARFLSRNILGRDIITGFAPGQLGMTVSKAGRTTGVTSATITDIDCEIDIEYDDDQTRHLVNQLTIEGTNVSLPGDSGSIWADDLGHAVGLNFAGQTDGTVGFANRFENVMSALQINLTNGVTMQDFNTYYPAAPLTKMINSRISLARTVSPF